MKLSSSHCANRCSTSGYVRKRKRKMKENESHSREKHPREHVPDHNYSHIQSFVPARSTHEYRLILREMAACWCLRRKEERGMG